MLRKLFPALLVGLFSFALTGCEEDPLSPDNPSMKATVDGTEKETSSVDALKTSTTITITGAFSDQTSINIVLNNVTAAGTITLPSLDGVITYTDLSTSPLTVYTGITGTIEISSIDDNGVTGEFSFNGSDGTSSVDVTSGTFSAKFQ